MIVGIGIDILDMRRIEGIIDRQGERFLRKIYTPQEREFCQKRHRFVESFAKIFALKEATIKAISHVPGVFWKDIEVGHDENGKPLITLHNAALTNLQKRRKNAAFHIEASTSDDYPYATAFVIIDSF